MNKSLQFLGAFIFFIFALCCSDQAAPTKANAKTIPAGYRSREVEGYYVSEPMDGETETCNLSVRIKKVQGQYIYAFNIDGRILKGKVRITKTDDPNELGIIFNEIQWAENNGDLSRTTKAAKLKLPDSIEGVWSASGIIIQNYGNSMNSYMKIASCGQKYINMVKQ